MPSPFQTAKETVAPALYEPSLLPFSLPVSPPSLSPLAHMGQTDQPQLSSHARLPTQPSAATVSFRSSALSLAAAAAPTRLSAARITAREYVFPPVGSFSMLISLVRIEPDLY